MSKYINIFRNDTISLSKNKDKEEFWLYDRVRGMNLSMEAKTEQEAFVDALAYYQKKLLETERDLRQLTYKVSNFVESVSYLEDEF